MNTATTSPTPVPIPRWKQLLLHSAFARVVIFVAIFGGLVFLLRILFVTLGWAGTSAPVPQRQIGQFVMQIVPALTAYLILVYALERRRPEELAWRKVLPHGALGFAGGFLLISTVVGALWLAGSYQVTGTSDDAHWIRQLMISGLGAAIAEEIMVRGVIFRISEEGLGTWGALILSAMLFGFGHIGNPGATIWSSVAIAIEAGLLLGMLFHVTRSLPLCIGLHMGWNFTQGTIWGVPVSGTKDPGWLVSTRTGPDWLSGGQFGAEASVVAVAICSAVTLALLVTAYRRGTIVSPWFRQKRAPAASPVPADNEVAKVTS